MSRMRVDDIHPYASSLSLAPSASRAVCVVRGVCSFVAAPEVLLTFVVLLLLPPCQCAWRRRLVLALRPLFGIVRIVAVFWRR
jgi:hypothetical protein